MMKQFMEPLKTIKDQSYPFTVWVLCAVGIGLVSFWLPLVLSIAKGQQCHVFETLMRSGTLAAFSIVLLSEAASVGWSVTGAGSNAPAAGIRSIASVFLIVLVILLSGIHSSLFSIPSTEGLPSFYIWAQIVLVFLSIGVSIYLYCLRDKTWEPGVENHQKEEDKEVGDIAQAAGEVVSDKEGTQL